MTEPARWRDEGPEAVRALLRHAPRTRGMTAADRTRTRSRIAGIVVGITGVTWLSGAAIGAGLGVVTVGAAHVVPLVPQWLNGPHADESSPRTAVPAYVSRPSLPRQVAPRASAAEVPAVAPEPRTLPVMPPEPPVETQPSKPPLKGATAAIPSSTDLALKDPTVDSLGEEAAFLERARASLRSDPERALGLCEAHARQYPQGKLVIEREMVAIEALGRSGRKAEARSRGEALLAHARGSLYEDRIDALLESVR